MRSTGLNILRSEITINIKAVSWKVVALFFFLRCGSNVTLTTEMEITTNKYLGKRNFTLFLNTVNKSQVGNKLIHLREVIPKAAAISDFYQSTLIHTKLQLTAK